MDIVKVGIIGVGGIAQNVHIKELLNVTEAKIAAVCDTNSATLEKVGSALNIPLEKRYTDYRQLVDDAEVNAVEICTPNYLHVEMAAYAIRAGKERDAYRNDHACTNAAVAGEQVLPCSSYPEKELTKEEHLANRQKWLENHPEA